MCEKHLLWFSTEVWRFFFGTIALHCNIAASWKLCWSLLFLHIIYVHLPLVSLRGKRAVSDKQKVSDANRWGSVIGPLEVTEPMNKEQGLFIFTQQLPVSCPITDAGFLSPLRSL